MSRLLLGATTLGADSIQASVLSHGFGRVWKWEVGSKCELDLSYGVNAESFRPENKAGLKS